MTKVYRAILTNGQSRFLYAINAAEALRSVGSHTKVKSIKLDIFSTLSSNYGSAKIFMSMKEAQAFAEQMALFLPVMPDFQTAAKMSMSRMSDKKASQRRLLIIQKQLDSGARQAEAVEAAGFPKEFISILKIAEDNSSLPEAFAKISVVLQERQELTRTMGHALVTPALTLIVLVVSFVFMLLDLYPRLTDLFQQASFGVPKKQQALPLQIDMYLTKNRYMIVAVVLGLFGFFILSLFYDQTRKLYTVWLFKIPFFRDLVLTWRVSKFCMAIEMPLTSALTTLDSLEKVVETASLAERKIYLRLRADVESGKTLKDALQGSGYFPMDFVQWIGSIEKSGGLTVEISRVRETYEKILRHKFETLKTVIGPFMIIFAGGAVLVMAAALYAPILSLVQSFMSQSP